MANFHLLKQSKSRFSSSISFGLIVIGQKILWPRYITLSRNIWQVSKQPFLWLTSLFSSFFIYGHIGQRPLCKAWTPVTSFSYEFVGIVVKNYLGTQMKTWSQGIRSCLHSPSLLPGPDALWLSCSYFGQHALQSTYIHITSSLWTWGWNPSAGPPVSMRRMPRALHWSARGLPFSDSTAVKARHGLRGTNLSYAGKLQFSDLWLSGVKDWSLFSSASKCQKYGSANGAVACAIALWGGPRIYLGETTSTWFDEGQD